MVEISLFFQWAQGLVETFSYLGIFVISLVATSTIVLPTFPLSAIVFTSGIFLNPILVGIAAGVGSATGELVGYFVGRGGKKVLLKKYEKNIKKYEKMFQKYKGPVVVFFFAAFPLVPFDFIGVFCGIIGYDIKKFYTALVIGKTIRYTAIALAGFYGATFILSYL